MPVTHAKSLTVADGTNTALARPGDWNSGHNLIYNLTGNTSNTSQVTGTDVVWEFAGGITGKGTSNTIQLSVPNNYTMQRLIYPPEWASYNTSGMGQNSLSVNYVQLLQDVAFSQVRLFASLSGATHTSASTNSFAATIRFGIYTRDGTTLNTLATTSGTWSSTYSTNSTASVNGVREFTIPLAATLPPGGYWLALLASTATTNAAMGVSFFLGANMGTTMLHPQSLGAATTSSRQIFPGMGIYSATTGALPASMAGTHMNSSGTAISRANFVFDLRNYTFYA